MHICPRTWFLFEEECLYFYFMFVFCFNFKCNYSFRVSHILLCLMFRFEAFVCWWSFFIAILPFHFVVLIVLSNWLLCFWCCFHFLYKNCLKLDCFICSFFVFVCFEICRTVRRYFVDWIRCAKFIGLIFFVSLIQLLLLCDR